MIPAAASRTQPESMVICPLATRYRAGGQQPMCQTTDKPFRAFGFLVIFGLFMGFLVFFGVFYGLLWVFMGFWVFGFFGFWVFWV